MSDTDFSYLNTSLWQNRKCIGICLFVAIANMQYGFDSAAVGGLQAMPGFLKVFGYEDAHIPGGYGIDPTFQRLISSLLTLGSFISSLMTGAFAIWFGRKPGLFLACVLCIASAIIQIVTTSKGVLYFARLLLGLGNGFLATCSTIYLSEASPAHLRGLAVAFFTFWIQIGNIIGTAVDYATSTRLDRTSYQIPLGCLFIVPMILGIGIWFVPESPRFLLYQGEDKAARSSLERLRGSAIPRDHIELEWAEMLRGIEEENKYGKEYSWIDMFRRTDLRRTLLCYGIIGIQTASGIWFTIAYQTYFFAIHGVSKAFAYSIMNTCIGFAGVLAGMYALRYVLGRRSILLIGSAASGACMLATAIAWSVAPNSQATLRVLVAFWALFYFFYSGSIGVVSYPVATELVSNKLRAWTVGSATSLGYVLAWLCSFCTPYFINPEELNWGAKYDYIWAAGSFITFLFVFFCIPEMKGRSLEEIDQLFAQKVSVRNFPKYHCTVLEGAVHDVQMKTGMFSDKTNAQHIDTVETTKA